MAEEKQLTVAELLARNAKERDGRESKESSAKSTEVQETPRRRRRRSLDDGGISVAELTGSIKRVDAEPARSRHSSTSDAQAPVIPAPKKTDKAAATKPAEPKATEPKTSEAKATKAKPTDSKSAPAKSTTPKPTAATSAAKKPVEADPADTKRADAKRADAKRADAKRADAKPAAKDNKKTPAADETTVIKKVEPSANDSAQSAAAVSGAAKTDETTVMPAQPAADKSKKPVAKPAGAAAVGTAAVGAAGTAAKPGVAKEADSTGEIPIVSDEAQADSALVDQQSNAEVENSDAESDDDGKLSAVSIVVLALVGVIIGAIIFKGFEVLWGRFDRIIVSILALVVTGAMVGIVHALRTARDAISMSMAGVVGLILTFGPLFIILL